VEGIETLSSFGAIGTQDQIYEGGFLLLQLYLLLDVAQVGVDADVMLALVLSEIEDFKRA